jgi:hypothetical protein
VQYKVNLKDFSLEVRGHITHNGFLLHTRDIANLVKSLPRSVSRLDINTCCFDRSVSDSTNLSDRLCVEINSGLPLLHDLGLRLARLRPLLLQSDPHTKEINQSNRHTTAITINNINPIRISNSED